MPRKVEIVEMPDSLAFSPATENVNKVPVRAWRKWNNQARYVFNEVFSQTECQKTLTYPRAEQHTDSQWRTIRWNIAWLAADSVMETVKQSSGKIKQAGDMLDCTSQVFIPLLQGLYKAAGLSIPEKVFPSREIRRLVSALKKA